MTVRKREYKNKENRQIWDYDFWYRGIRYRQAGFQSKAEAEIAQAKERQQIISGKVPIRPCTFEDITGPFLEHRRGRIAPSTFTNDKNRIPHISAVFGKKLLASITPSDINDYMNVRLNTKKAARTINLEINLLSSIFQFAIDQGLLTDNPARRVKRLKTIQNEPWLPTIEQFRSLIDAARKTETCLELATWIIFRGYTGTRPAESFFMEWKDIDFTTGLVHIRPKDGNQLKNSKFRVVPMHDELKTALLEWKTKWDKTFDGKPPHDWVFFNPRFPHIRCQRFERSYPRARKLAGLTEHMTSHCLRHFFISKAVESGVNFLVIAKWVGHSGTRMIEQVYAHLSPDFKKGEMDKLQLGIVNPPTAA